MTTKIKTRILRSSKVPVNTKRRRLHIRWSRIITYACLTTGSILMIAPFMWMVLSGFKQPQEIIVYPPVWFPANPTLTAFIRLWTEFEFKIYFINSIIVTSVVVVAVTISSAVIGFVLAKYQFPGRNLVFFLIIATMMIPWPTLLIPQYWIVLKLDWMNTYSALIVPLVFSAYGIFLVRQYMHAVPDELLDAGRIDGATEPIVFFRIVIPLSFPALAAVGILHFLWTWDSFIWPLVVTNSKEMFTLPIGLQLFAGQHSTDYVMLNAASSVSVIPILIIFILLQRYFIEGIAMSGMKV